MKKKKMRILMKTTILRQTELKIMLTQLGEEDVDLALVVVAPAKLADTQPLSVVANEDTLRLTLTRLHTGSQSLSRIRLKSRSRRSKLTNPCIMRHL